jgi:hypothetical protein
MPWREAVDYVIGGPAEYLRDVGLMVAGPLLIVRGRNGIFLFFYLCAVWLLCLNPLLAPPWMKNVFAYSSAAAVAMHLTRGCGSSIGTAGQLGERSTNNCAGTCSGRRNFRLQLPRTLRSKARHRLEGQANTSCFPRTLILPKPRTDTSRIPSFSHQTGPPAVSYASPSRNESGSSSGRQPLFRQCW